MKEAQQQTYKVQYSTRINAAKEKVWNTMLNEDTYRNWTDAFTEGSYYKGSWDKGSKILFLDPEGSGMVSRIADNKPYQFVSIEHLGFVKDGVEDLESEEAKAVTGAYENYTFTEKDGATEVLVELDLNDQYKEMFDELWPKALAKLKKIIEE